MAVATLCKIDALITIVDRALTGVVPFPNKDDGLNPSENENIVCKPFGRTIDGHLVDIYILRNSSGMEVEIINFGGHIRAVRVPSSVKNDESLSHETVDVTIGLDNMFDYQYKNRFFGPIVGRFCNRICKGKFTLNGKEYQLPINNGPNALHGGLSGFDKKVWTTRVMKNRIGVTMQYSAADGEEGYPSACHVTVEYVLGERGNTLEINYKATSDGPTVINLTNHAYWNLNGDFTKNSIADGSHSFQINADYFLPIDDTSIPLGSLQSVINTPFDLRQPSDDLGSRIHDNLESNEQIKNGTGFDHNFCINRAEEKDGELTECAVVIGKKSGIRMKVVTDQPGVQFYTANFLNGSMCGKGKIYDQRSSFCLETQHFPDSPNHKTFPTTILNKGEVFKTTTRYSFDTV